MTQPEILNGGEGQYLLKHFHHGLRKKSGTPIICIHTIHFS